jgi:plastocyanin
MDQTTPPMAPSFGKDMVKNSALSSRPITRMGLVVAAAAALALAMPLVHAADGVSVSQQNRTFMPEKLTVTRGTTVHIANDDDVTHHVYVDSPNMKFDSGEQPIGATVDLRFDADGTFPVRCAIHPTMRLNVTVR